MDLQKKYENMLKPLSREEWKEIADKHKPEPVAFKHIKGDVVVSGAWLEGEMVGFANCMMNCYYPLLDSIEEIKTKANNAAIDKVLALLEPEVSMAQFKLMKEIRDLRDDGRAKE